MSNFMTTAIHKKTGETHEVTCMDNHFGHRQYGYMVGDKVMPQEQFEREYERTKNDD